MENSFVLVNNNEKISIPNNYLLKVCETVNPISTFWKWESMVDLGRVFKTDPLSGLFFLDPPNHEHQQQHIIHAYYVPVYIPKE